MLMRRLAQLSALAVAALALGLFASQPIAVPEDIYPAVLAGLAFTVAILAGAILLALRLTLGRVTPFWESDAGSRQLAHIFIMLLLAVLIIGAVGILLDRLGRLDAVSTFATSVTTLTLLPLAFWRFGLIHLPARVRSLSLWRLLLTGTVLSFLAAAYSWGAISTDPVQQEWPSVRGTLLLLLALIVAAAPEEIIFRLLLLTALADQTRSRIDALVLSAVVFALVHAPLAVIRPLGSGDWEMSLVWAADYAPVFVGQVLMGLLLGAIWLRTGSIIILVLVHALMNVGATLINGF